jgi:hypothetical protein
MTTSLTATDPSHDHQLEVGVQDLIDFDAAQVRKQLSDGIAHPDNESSSNIHHTARTRADFRAHLSARAGPTVRRPIPVFVSSGPTREVAERDARAANAARVAGGANMPNRDLRYGA